VTRWFEKVQTAAKSGRQQFTKMLRLLRYVAADFIRNLREETKKGFYGRLKQGLYPIGASIGYVDHGKGNLRRLIR